MFGIRSNFNNFMGETIWETMDMFVGGIGWFFLEKMMGCGLGLVFLGSMIAVIF